MRLPSRTSVAWVLLVVGGMFMNAAPARAQGDGLDSSLGGYGAVATPAMPQAGSTPIPYAGGFAGFMPYRMAGGAALAFRTRPNAGMGLGPVRSSFSLTSPAAGMAAMSGRMEASSGSEARLFSTSPLRGGMGSLTGTMGVGSMSLSGTGPGGMGVMPPSIGYPFRQPPSLLSTSSGMSMAMP